MLTEASPAAAARLHPNDLRRIIRALEVHQFSGETVSQHKEADKELIYDAAVIGLTMPRAILYERINMRVDSMIANGLVAEVSRLLSVGVSPQAQAMQGIGYKEIAAYLNGAGDLSATIASIKQTTRHFAKRQMTWFRKMPYIEWINVDNFGNYNEMLVYIYNSIAGKFNLE
jgi:tRNA dimethylallyltransferase